MIMFAEVYKDGQWHKVGKEFTSWWPELNGQFTDRVCDEPNNFFLLTALGKDINFMHGHTIYPFEVTKGLPEDASPDIVKSFQGKEVFCLDLSTLINYPWDRSIHQEGFINEWQYKRLKNSNIEPVHILKPKRISDYNDDTHEYILQHQMDLILENPSLRKKAHYYVLYEYDHTTLREQCEFFYTKSIPKLIELALCAENMIRVIYCL